MSSDYLPPHITHEDKGVGGDKKGDHRIQYAVFGLSLFYLAHYTPIVGIALEWCIALLFVVLPLVGQRGTELLADVTEATATYYQRYGQPPSLPLLTSPHSVGAGTCLLLERFTN